MRILDDAPSRRHPLRQQKPSNGRTRTGWRYNSAALGGTWETWQNRGFVCVQLTDERLKSAPPGLVDQRPPSSRRNLRSGRHPQSSGWARAAPCSPWSALGICDFRGERTRRRRQRSVPSGCVSRCFYSRLASAPHPGGGTSCGKAVPRRHHPLQGRLLRRVSRWAAARGCMAGALGHAQEARSTGHGNGGCGTACSRPGARPADGRGIRADR